MSLRSSDSLVAPAVAATLGALELAVEDAAAARLAERYAAQLDQASEMEAAADRVLRRASEEDVELVEEVRALRQKLAAHVILTQVGPKLHEVLTSLERRRRRGPLWRREVRRVAQAVSKRSGRPAARKKLLGRTEPREFTPPLRKLTRATSRGFELADFAEKVVGEPLLAWQRWLAIHALELDPGGGYRFRVVLALCGRQNGKSSLLRTLTLWRMYVDGARLALGVAQDLSTARHHLRLADRAVLASSDLGRSGSSWRARSGMSGCCWPRVRSTRSPRRTGMLAVACRWTCW